MRLLYLFLIVSLYLSCDSKKATKEEPIAIQSPKMLLTEEEKNDSRWIRINNSDCYIFDYWTEDGVTFEWEGDCFDGKVNGYGKAVKY